MNATAAIIGALTLFLPALGGFIVTMVKLFRKIDANKVDTDGKLLELHKLTNGMSEKLNEAKFKQGDAEGHERGLQEGREEAK